MLNKSLGPGRMVMARRSVIIGSEIYEAPAGRTLNENEFGQALAKCRRVCVGYECVLGQACHSLFSASPSRHVSVWKGSEQELFNAAHQTKSGCEVDYDEIHGRQ